MNDIELTSLSLASEVSYKLLSFLHKFWVLMYFVKHFFQLFKRWLFAFHNYTKVNSIYKFVD